LKGNEEMSLSEPGHPLFLTEDSDDDPVNVSEIQIARVENGQQVFYPRLFPATELQSLEQVAAELGGGSYILIARHEGRITTRRKYVLPGKPKPMYDESRQEKDPPAAVVPPINPMSAMGGESGLMGLIMMMMQQMMQQQAQAAQSQTQMFIAMMQGNAQSSAEEKAQARAELQANIERERISSERTMSLMREMMMAKGGGGAGEDFTRGVEFMRSFATQQIDTLRANAKGEDNDWSSILETLGQVMQGVGMLKQVNAGGALPDGIPGAEAVSEAAQ
jgi:hypothetical protein